MKRMVVHYKTKTVEVAETVETKEKQNPYNFIEEIVSCFLAYQQYITTHIDSCLDYGCK